MKSSISREKLALILACVVGLVVLVLAAMYVAQKHESIVKRLAELEPRHARLLGLEASRSDLGRVEAEAAALVIKYAYPASQELSQVGNDAQQRVRNVFAGAGMELTSSQVLPAKQEKTFDRISLVVRTEGDAAAMQTAFIALSSQTPVIVVDGLSFQVAGLVRPDAPARLSGQFTLSVLRVRP